MTTFFTADQHFGHGHPDILRERGFSNVSEMDEALIAKWNAVVKPKDTIYQVGDFTLENPIQACLILRRLHGHIKIVPASPGHDHWIDGPFDFQEPFKGKTGLPDHVEILPALVTIKAPKVESGLGKKGNHVIALCHYPMLSWDRSHYGSWHLHGHSHGMRGKVTGKYSLDIGVDCWDLAPVNLATVADAIMNPWKFDPEFGGHPVH